MMKKPFNMFWYIVVQSRISQTTLDITIAELKINYGGEMPNWQEFIEAAKKQNIKVDKTVAANVFALPAHGVPQKLSHFMGILLWLSFLLAPATLFVWIFYGISAWWILIAIVTSLVIIRAIRKYMCISLIKSAIKSEPCYINLVNNGAFIFKP